MISEKIHEYIENNKEAILKDYFDILKIPSISDTQGAIDVLHFIKALYEKNGFEADLYDDYLLSHYKKGEKTIGLFAHADVVPVDDKWTKTNPFEPKIVDGELFARGSGDDKSAIIISLYALKAIKELNIPFNSSLLCFTGGNMAAVPRINAGSTYQRAPVRLAQPLNILTVACQRGTEEPINPMSI